MQYFLLYILMVTQIFTFSDVLKTPELDKTEEINPPQTFEERKATIENTIMETKPNEMGQIMVVMYHNLVEDEKKEGYYARSYDNFRKDLERLWSEGYVPISMTDFITGNIDIPAGKSPVVLTFDDGHPTDIKFLENGELDPKCVVGILDSFYQEHPDFVPRATFYLFGDHYFSNEEQEKKIKYLLEHGYELGNHTTNHNNIRKSPEDKAKAIIFGQAQELERASGQKTFHFSVPFGEKPKSYPEWVANQSWLAPYEMLSSVNVGWNPVASPYDTKFNKFSINRITVGEDNCELYFWMDALKNKPSRKYISDGDIDVITIPSGKLESLNPIYKENRHIAVYDESGVQWITE